jgi:hypothetical protein
MSQTRITLVQVPNGRAEITSGGELGTYGRRVTITVTPNPGYEFLGFVQTGDTLPPPLPPSGTGGGGADFCVSDADCNDPGVISDSPRICVDGTCQDTDIRAT